MQTKKHKRTVSYTRRQRILAFLLSALLFLLPFSVLPAMAAEEGSGGELSAQADTPLRFTIEWENVTYDASGRIAKATTARTVRVRAIGSASQTGTVTVSTFDISAKAGRDYTAVDQTFTLSGGTSGSFTVGKGNQKNVKTGAADMLTSVNGALYSREFGVRIVWVSDGATYDEDNILRGYVGGTGDTLFTTRNTNLATGSGEYTSYYNNGMLNSHNGYMAYGYSYVGASRVFSDTIYDYAGDGVLEPPPTVKVDGKKWFQFFFKPLRTIENNADTSKLRSYFSDSVKVYYSGTMTISDYRPVIATDGYSFEVREGDRPRYYNGVAGDRNWDSNKSPWFDTSNPYYNYSDKDTSKIVAIDRINTHFIEYLGVSNTISFYSKNWASYDKQYSGIQMRTTLSDNTAPVVKEFYIAPSLKSTSTNQGYNDGDVLYLAVRFSKPVQVETYDDTDKFKVVARVGSSQNELHFIYEGGAYTDTLIFKATLDATTSSGARRDMTGTSLTIVEFRNDTRNYVRVADMLVNNLNLNNSADTDNGIPIPGDVSKTIDCLIDTRIPKLEISEPSGKAAQAHSPTVTVTNTTLNGKLEYAWSTAKDYAAVTERFSDYSALNKNGYVLSSPNTVTGTGFTGEHYLHVRFTSDTGVVVTASSNPDRPFLFDNAPPTIVQPSEVDYAFYQKEHTIKIEIGDTYSTVSKIWLYLTDFDGNPVTNAEGAEVYNGALVYSLSGPTDPNAKKMTLTTRTEGSGEDARQIDTYSVKLDYIDVALPENSFATYFVEFIAEDSLGNRSELTANKSAVMYDNRPTFAASIPESTPPDEILKDFTIYYNKPQASENFKINIYSKDAFGTHDVYTLYTVGYEGRTVYAGGSWTTGKTYADYGFASDPSASTSAIMNEAGKLHAVLSFLPTAAGQYTVVYQRNGGTQSDVVSFYVSPENATPTNYEAISSDERLLINKVYPFVIRDFYKSVGSAGDVVAQKLPYDSAQGPQVPIFSSREKAVEYALFMEYQDIEKLYLGTDKDSYSYIESLESGRSPSMRKAAGETQEAAPGQIWIRYKSIDWQPTGTQDQAAPSVWVYYYYGRSEDPSEKLSLSRIKTNTLLYEALENNAREIAGAAVKDAATGMVITAEKPATYLTANNNSLDSFGSPTYSKTAVFFHDITIPADRTVFSTDLVYTGDSGIYDSKIDYEVSAGHVKTDLPYISDYIFEIDGAYERVYIAPSGGQDYKAVANGTNLRDAVDGSGVYRIAEIGHGYRLYEIYVDVDAPLVAYYSGNGSGYLSDTMSGGDFLSKWLTLRYVVDTDPSHAAAGRPVEYDSYSYMYLTSGKMPVTVKDFKTADEINAYDTPIPDGDYTEEELTALQKEAGYRIAPGIYELYIYDRLGNRTVLKVRTNDTDIFPVTKTEEEGDIEVYEPKIRPDVDITFTMNRTLEEVASYEVRLNSAIIDTEYAPTKTYVRSGKYTVTVTDIYGNTERVEHDFVRKPPVVEFYYKNPIGAGYTKMVLDENGISPAGELAVVEKQPPADADLANLSEVYVISTSVDIRISYDSSAKYKFTVTPSSAADLVVEPNNAYHKLINIPATETMWKIEIYHENDPDTKIIATCIKDVTPPEITASAEIPMYLYNDEHRENGEFVKNVLFRRDENSTSTMALSSGDSLGAGAITFSIQDETEISRMYYTLDGGEAVAVPLDKSTATVTDGGDYIYHATVTRPGTYVFTAMDILGNTRSFEATIDTELDFTAEANGRTLVYQTNPSAYIEGALSKAIYTDTSYIGQELRLTLREDMLITFLWTDGTQKHIYQISYHNRTVEFCEMLYEDPDSMVTLSYSLAEAHAGTLVTRDGYGLDILYEELYYDEKGKPVTAPTGDGGLADNGIVRSELALVFGAPYLPYELLQMRFTTPEGYNPYILQVERSNTAPSLQLLKPDGSALLLPEEGFVGVNSELQLFGTTTGLLSVYGYRSPTYTEDFSGVPAENVTDLFQNGMLGKLTGDGFYMVVATNKYHNTQTIRIRISKGMNIDVLLHYLEASDRGFTISTSGEYSFYTNKDAVIKVWDAELSVDILKDGVIYNYAYSEGDGFREIPLQAVGEYLVVMRDECENNFRFRISIAPPVELPYIDYLTGFNEYALRRDENYTNAPLSISGEACQAGGVQYIAFRPVGDGPFTVLADAISQEKLGYSEDRFENSIGKEDGSYEVIFTDLYGNLARIYVHISRKEQLFITRRTQSGKDFTPIALLDAERDGAWSNYILRLQNTASKYRLTVDGALTYFDEKGVYESLIPQGQGEANLETSIVYIDEYGNRYSFVIHMFRKVPVIDEHRNAPIYSLGGEMYVKGDIAYSWERNNIPITATKLLNNKTLSAYTENEWIDTDGKYLLTFTDIAGNATTVRVARDTMVSCDLHFGGVPVQNGVTADGIVRIRENGESVTILSATRDGEAYAADSLSFSEHGAYRVTVQDAIGNQKELYFSIYAHPVQPFLYKTDGDYVISQLLLSTGTGQLSLIADVTKDPMTGKDIFHFYGDGSYTVTLFHSVTEEKVEFELDIDNAPPAATLVGAVSGIPTRYNVSFEELEGDEIIEVYKNGELFSVHDLSATGTSPVISEAGAYRVVIRDAAGNETVYEFVREFTTNAPTNIVICIVVLVFAVGGIIFVRSRARVRSK